MVGGFCVFDLIGQRRLPCRICPTPKTPYKPRKTARLLFECGSLAWTTQARVFREALGLSVDDAEWLQKKLLEGIQKHPAEKQETDDFGSRWRVDTPLTRQDKSVVVRAGWIIKAGEQFPRLITCWVL